MYLECPGSPGAPGRSEWAWKCHRYILWEAPSHQHPRWSCLLNGFTPQAPREMGATLEACSQACSLPSNPCPWGPTAGSSSFRIFQSPSWQRLPLAVYLLRTRCHLSALLPCETSQPLRAAILLGCFFSGTAQCSPRCLLALARQLEGRDAH